NGNTVQEVEKKKDTGKTESNRNTVQEVEKKKDTEKTVQEVEKKKDTRKTVSDTVHEIEKKKDTGKTVGDTVQKVEKKKESIGNWDNQRPRASRERENFYSSEVYNDAGRRNLTPGKEYRVTNNHVKRVWRQILPVDSTKETNVTHMANSAADVNDKLAISNTSHSHKLTTASSASNELKMSSPKA
nr:UBA-like, GBF-interacting protein 1 [Tanacetum cinerariifolium]